MTVKTDQHGLTVQAARPALSQTIAVGAASVASAPFQVATAATGSYSAGGANVGQRINTPNQTLHVRLVATADCWVAFGASPAALGSAPSSIFLPAGVVEYFWVFPGEQVAVIQNAGAGLLNVAEMLA